MKTAEELKQELLKNVHDLVDQMLDEPTLIETLKTLAINGDAQLKIDISAQADTRQEIREAFTLKET